MPRRSRSRHLRLIALLALLALTPGAPPATAQDGTEAWIALFNGKSLDGWIPKIKGYAAGENYADTFRVEDGVIKVAYDKYSKFDSKFGHLFYKQKFGNYRLRVEYRFVGNQCPGGPSWALRNSGAMIFSQSPESMRTDQDFPVSIEVQFLGGNGKDPRPTGNVCTPGTHLVMDEKLITQHCNNSTSPTIHGDEWVTAEVEVRGGSHVKHMINGRTVIEYDKPQLDPGDADARKLIEAAGGEKMLDNGYVCLQAESHPIEFRKVEILPLDK